MTVSATQADSTETASKPSFLSRYGEQLALPFAWLLIIIFFSFKSPELFPTTRNLGSILGTQTALFILALAALLPAMSGDLDLSLGFAGAFAAMVMAVLNTQHGWGIVPAALLALVIGCACGVLNGIVVVKLKTEPFIMTLGTGAIFQGFVLWVSDSNTVTNVARGLSTWTLQTKVWVIPIQFFYAIAIMLVIWWVAEHTPLGVRWLFVGKSRDVARLSGINSDRIRFGSFVAAGALAGVRGRGVRRQLGLDVAGVVLPVPPAGVCSRLPRRHHDPARAVQSDRHDDRRALPGDRRAGPADPRRRRLHPVPVLRRHARRGRRRLALPAGAVATRDRRTVGCVWGASRA